MFVQSTSTGNNDSLTDVVEGLVMHLENMPCDRDSISQESLDLANKFRTSLLPWRGQFSPELIEIFLNAYSEATDVVFDPFVGSGTTLFEAARKGLRGYGAEINPAAVEMSKTAQFAPLTLEERRAIIRDTEKRVKKYMRPLMQDLFSDLDQEPDTTLEFIDNPLLALIQEVADNIYSYNIVANTLIRYMSYKEPRSATDFMRALREHARVIESIPHTLNEYEVFHVDARSVPLPEGFVDIIITSPPYINVFNYHQNNRQAMEALGWNILEIAKSEIGANRKNRGNRFLTVIQYALDMLDALKEMRRVLKSDGRAIIVVGKESSIRSIHFRNGLIVALLAVGGAGFQLERKQERKFRNKFGELIYEDILHFLPSPHASQSSDAFAREVAVWCLKDALRYADGSIRREILDAVGSTTIVAKSPLFDRGISKYKKVELSESMRRLVVKERGYFMIEFPKPHIEKLKAIRESNKLPKDDIDQVDKTIQYYQQWITVMNAVTDSNASYDEKLKSMVAALNEYRLHIDIDLIFDSHEDWLYREKGQIKLDNSVIEEFLPRLVYACLREQIVRANASVGPTKAFAAMWFDSSLLRSEKGGGMKIRTKDQDFAISKPLYLCASDTPDFKDAVTEATNLAYIAAECKTNLDKTMFQEACATAGDLKAVIPGAKYFLLCEWLDMPPISSDITPIDKVYILRKAKRLNSNIRGQFRTFEGRQKHKQFYRDFLSQHPIQYDIFDLFLREVKRLLEGETLDEKTALERGYF